MEKEHDGVSDKDMKKETQKVCVWSLNDVKESMSRHVVLKEETKEEESNSIRTSSKNMEVTKK